MPDDAANESYPPQLMRLIRAAYRRLRADLVRSAPTLSIHTRRWMRSLSGGAPAERYFTHPDAFPMLLLPWWLEETVRGTPDPAFHGDLVLSTINGYYFVRMIDDVMDGEAEPDPRLLPALISLHTQFLLPFLRHLPGSDPFWEQFREISMASAEMASRDAGPRAIDQPWFEAISARKVVGARVPLAAVCHRYHRMDLADPWFRFVDVLGRWHQMRNDIIDWGRDLAAGRPSWFLSEAKANAADAGAIARWVVGPGLQWGLSRLEAWMDDLVAQSDRLGSPSLTAYLERRQRSSRDAWQALEPSLDALARLETRLVGPATRSSLPAPG